MPEDAKLLEPGRLQRPDGSVVKVGKNLISVRTSSDEYIMVFPAYVFGKIIELSSNCADNFLRWVVVRDPDCHIVVESSARTVWLPKGRLDLSRPIQTVMQIGSYYPVCMKPEANEMNSILCFDESAARLWEYDGNYTSIWLGDDESWIRGTKKEYVDKLDITTGALLGTLYER